MPQLAVRTERSSWTYPSCVAAAAEVYWAIHPAVPMALNERLPFQSDSLFDNIHIVTLDGVMKPMMNYVR